MRTDTVRFLIRFPLTFISITVCRALVLAESGAFSNLRCISYTQKARKRVSVLLIPIFPKEGRGGDVVVVACRDDFPRLVRH